MNIVVQQPTRPGPAGDAARRIATWVGPGIAAPDGSRAAAFYLALGTTIATTRAYTAGSLAETVGSLAVDTLPAWERSLGMLSGEGGTVAERQQAVTARWRAIHAGPSLAEITTTVRSFEATADVVEIAQADVYDTDPKAAQRIVVLLPDAVEASSLTRARLAAALTVQAPAHVAWSLARGDGPDIDPFLCDDVESQCERDVLSI